MEAMAKHRTYSIEFKRQVAQEYIAGETLHAPADATEAATAAVRRMAVTPSTVTSPMCYIQCRAWRRAMVDVAHEASGPASPEPGDIALQQASRPDSPDRGKLRVFISYSR